jgi:alkylhydroperoxidase/carboxymuconolactone decarboxylase family protein YurZ
MPLEVLFQETSEDVTIPVFRPRGPSARPGSGVAIVITVAEEQQDWNFPFEGPRRGLPVVAAAQNAWLSQIDSLKAPDRKTHELIRMACTVILRNPAGVRRHAMLAKEVGASWDEILGSIMLTLPGFGLLPAVEAIPHARAGFDAAPEPEEDV